MNKVFLKFFMSMFICFNLILAAEVWYGDDRHVAQLEVSKCTIGGTVYDVAFVEWVGGGNRCYFILDGSPKNDYWFKLLYEHALLRKQFLYKYDNVNETIDGETVNKMVGLKVQEFNP